MIKEAIDRILEFRDIHHLEIGGRNYTNKPLHDIREPMPAPIEIETLIGITDYLEANVDLLDKNASMVHVADHKTVNIISSIIEPFQQRACHLKATHNEPVFSFDQFMPSDIFIISLQQRFIQDATSSDLLKIVGNLKKEESLQQKDDGVTQEATIKTGITRVEKVDVPNPVVLRPHRTFTEVYQPESQFVFRLRSDPSGGISCALFEADGGAWKKEAIHNIRDWLQDKISGIAVIA